MNKKKRELEFDSIAVHSVSENKSDVNIKSVVPPIYQTSTFEVPNVKTGAEYANEVHPTEFYTRWGNPTTRILEKTVSELEYGEDAIATSSGMSAISMAILSTVKKGDKIVAQKALYGGTEELLTNVLPQYGIKYELIDAKEINEVKKALTKDVALFYMETPSNPTMDIIDIKECSEIANKNNIPVFVDNTFASPYNQNPIKRGASIVLHSATKYLGGHSDVIGGIIVGEKERVKKAWKTLKIFGPCLSPFDSWLVLRGIRTLPVRMKQHNKNAMELAEFLSNNKNVSKVNYPGLSSKKNKTVNEQMKGYGGMLSFEMKGGFNQARKFVENVKLARLAVSLGGVETLVEHPASMTHGMLSEELKKKAGITDVVGRTSVGIEDIKDIINDFDNAIIN